jgi:hypothetical protein
MPLPRFGFLGFCNEAGKKHPKELYVGRSQCCYLLSTRHSSSPSSGQANPARPVLNCSEVDCQQSELLVDVVVKLSPDPSAFLLQRCYQPALRQLSLADITGDFSKTHDPAS